MPTIQLIGLDLDGTLLRPDGSVGPEEAQALLACAEAGVRVVPSTGRGWHEAAPALAQLPHLELGVFATGGTVARLADGEVLDAVHFEPTLAADLIDRLSPLPDALLAFSVRGWTGFDYTVLNGRPPTPQSDWWFKHTRARLRRVDGHGGLSSADLASLVRLSVVSRGRDLDPLVDTLRDDLGDRIEVHAFGGVESVDDTGSDTGVRILEVFPSGTHKWRGLAVVADHYGIAHDAVAAVGDEINDLPALRHAALSVAMGNAIPAVKAAADYVVQDNTQAGAAEALRWILEASS